VDYIDFYITIGGNSSRKGSLSDLEGTSKECNFEKWEATRVTFLRGKKTGEAIRGTDGRQFRCTEK